MHFTDFDPETFLRDHWQKKPLLIRDPWNAWRNPLDPDELAGLACEEAVESRLVAHAADTDGDRWAAEHGPFRENRFGELPPQRWTLLVQAVDHYVPEVAALIEPFRFIPDWRIDDVMASLAANGGGVGPHFDQYDVFLIQGLGKRRWQIGATCDDKSALLPHDDLRLLAQFEATEEWVLEPGDILYIPPGIAHNGVAVGDDCMTYSIGFRAPSRSQLIAHWADHVLAELTEDDRYTDPDLRLQGNPGEISAEAIAKLHAMVMERMGGRNAFARWFGEFSTSPKYPDIDWRPDAPMDAAEIRRRLEAGATLVRNPASRFSFVQKDAGGALLFVDGECFECSEESGAFVERLCAEDSVATEPSLIKSEPAMELIRTLVDRGSVTFETDD
ncbi:cupin domain-containing protein [Parasphingopyxis algicola]|uniref:cupin domain-containing protein n=1 Tax=Parasphingopyxis algicola TaxID=2026624 RepID=UPI0015A38848|nr:cupin domain-containing protein [Parasphingopyxis algicola]QLC24452.1 cupin domain-containing protein [Parasphingopyxis algicola]